ncbi:hypothetical protein HWV62_6941 [Athelia sp. TMB]|nr:hypothetical protein HWV62_37914 [Athelia sp. TMB]KAF7976374.1 hypothetical protein HWV62_6941 [Athelia sp. TMB]
MVVTRKTPLVPPAPGSKANASQATPKVAKAKGQAVSTSPLEGGSGAGLSTGTGSTSGKSDSSDMEVSESKKSKNKSKKERKKARKSGRTFWDFLVNALFIAFAVYTATVCPSDKANETAVCRGLNKYRELVLEPIIYPAFHHVIEHPSVSPYVAQVQPYVDKTVRFSTPIIYRTKSEWNGRIVPQWNKRIVPQWNKRVVPQWNKHVIPQWEKHVVPQIMAVDAKIEPYRTLATQEYTRYSSMVTPHVIFATQKLQEWQHQAQPYVILAAHKTHEGYQTAKPYAIPLWNRFVASLRELLILLKEQRVMFVDPHVARIWEKVKELSSGKPAEPRITIFEAAPSPSAAAPLVPAETIAESMSATAFSSSEETPTSLSSTTSSSTVASSAAPTETSTEFVVSVVATATSWASEASSAVSEINESTASIITAVVPESTTSSIFPSPLTIPSTTLAPPATTSSSAEAYATTGPSLILADVLPTGSAVDFDLDEFTRSLGLDDEEAPEQEAVVVEDEGESEAEKAENARLKAIKTAEDRANIEKRHAKWEQDMDALMKANTKKLKKKLNAIRKPAAEELNNSKAVRTAIDVVVSEADKYLKGGEAYLQTIKAEEKKASDKLALWSKVMDKVNTKFQDRLGEVDTIVNEWYMDVLNQENIELLAVTEEVSTMSGEAQADLGMDYSWLGDVTYQDWQRYHDLARASENFTTRVTELQRGTGESPMHNPITAILEDLEEELQDIVGGFEARHRSLRRDGERALSGKAPQPIASASEPELSILPVPQDDGNGETKAADIPPIIIGRSQEEIVDALSRAESAGTSSHTVHEEPADTVETLAHEASMEAEKATSTPIPAHVEL